MIILPFSLGDQAEVAAFWARIWKEMGWNDEIEGNNDIPSFLHFPKGFLFVVRENERILGCAGIKPLTEQIGIVKRFYLDKSLRSTGVAKQLLDEVIHESKRKGFTSLVLDVYYTNLRAKRFYEKNGFSQYAQTPVPGWEESRFPKEFFYYKLSRTE